MSVRDNVDSEAARIARCALEEICSGARLDRVTQYYSPRFVDHVNGVEVTDTLGMLRQLGLWRFLLVMLNSLGRGRATSRSSDQ